MKLRCLFPDPQLIVPNISGHTKEISFKISLKFQRIVGNLLEKNNNRILENIGSIIRSSAIFHNMASDRFKIVVVQPVQGFVILILNPLYYAFI